MRICHTLFHEMPVARSWRQFANTFPWLAQLMEAQSEHGDEVLWLTRGGTSNEIRHGRACIRWMKTAKKAIFRSFHRKGLEFEIEPFLKEMVAAQADVIHHHDASDWRSVTALAETCATRSIPLLVQHHGGFPRGHNRQKLPFGTMVFGDESARNRFVAAGLVDAPRTAERFLAASDFRPVSGQQRRRLRQQLGMHGRPVFGWAGNLTKNKDPLLVLEALAARFALEPSSRYYVCYRNGALLAACRSLVRKTPALRKRVVFLGALPHGQMECFFQCLDYFVQASHHEAQGFAPVEAMCAGAVPILTDIPSFRLLTEQGRYGRLFPAGDRGKLEWILADLPATPDPTLRAEIAAYTASRFSYATVAATLRRLYQQCMCHRPDSIPGEAVQARAS